MIYKLIKHLLLTSFTILLFVASTLATVRLAYATAPNPLWWITNTGAFSQYDDYQYKNGRTHQGQSYPGSGVDSYILNTNASYDGVTAIGPRPAYDGVNDVNVYFATDVNSTQENEWECVELVKRFLFLEYGSRSIAANGSEVVDNYVGATYGYTDQFKKISNDGSAQVYPKPGDVVGYGSTIPGHTALVKSVTSQLNGNATVQLLEQNASASGLVYQNFSNWQFQNGIDNNPNNTDTITGWLTNRWVDNSPTGTTKDIIYSMSASSTSNVWAAGIERTSPNIPVTYYDNGSGWTKYYPPNMWNTQRLWGIATSSTGDTWTVGALTSYPSWVTLAYHWNSSTHAWSRVTSDNPSTSYPNYLNGVGIDGGGSVWAVGNYWPTTNSDLPLLEKWNGTKFAQQSLSLPSGASAGELYGISFSSATNGWAVGWASATSSSSLIYHYDGSTWTPTLGSINMANLKSVYAVSDTEAWAVGTQKPGSTVIPLILHYTSANGWQEDTGFASVYPGYGGILSSVSGDSASNIWIVNGYYLMHYDGNKWNKVLPKAYPGIAGVFKSVTVNSGNVWAGGLLGSEGSWQETPVVFRNF